MNRRQLHNNHNKCSVLPVKLQCPASINHHGGYLLKEVKYEKDLSGMFFTALKAFADTIWNVTSANRFFCAVRRSFERLTPTIFRKVFFSHIKSILESGQPAVYSITNGESLILEGVQRRGSKLVTGLCNRTYPKRLAQLNMFLLALRRVRENLIHIRRILNSILGEDVRGYFLTVSDSLTRGHGWKLVKQRRLRLDPCMALSSRVVNLWNALPAEVAESTMEAEFKRRLNSYFRLRTTDCCQRCNIQDPHRIEVLSEYGMQAGLLGGDEVPRDSHIILL